MKDTTGMYRRITHFLTGAILTGFVLIILLTTLSTGPFVQTVGKALYYLIVLSGLGSVVVWRFRSRSEKKFRQGTGQAGPGVAEQVRQRDGSR